MRIAICDDNVLDARRLAALIGGDHAVALFPSAEALLTESEEAGARFDLYMLDIFMGGIDGLELAGRLREMDDEALLCFVSTSKDFYREAYDLYAFQYLLKPVGKEVLQELLRRTEERLRRDRERMVTLEQRGRHMTIPYGRILFIASRDHTIYIQCKGGRQEKCSGRLSELAEQLDGGVFARCHQSYIVNLYNVEALEGDDFVCEEFRVPISRRWSGAKERYRALLFEEMR